MIEHVETALIPRPIEWSEHTGRRVFDQRKQPADRTS